MDYVHQFAYECLTHLQERFTQRLFVSTSHLSPNRRRAIRHLANNGAASQRDTTESEEDSFVAETIASLSARKKWPVKRNKLEQFVTNEAFNRIRRHESEKYKHTCIEIPKKDGNKEGPRYPCILYVEKATACVAANFNAVFVSSHSARSHWKIQFIRATHWIFQEKTRKTQS